MCSAAAKQQVGYPSPSAPHQDQDTALSVRRVGKTSSRKSVGQEKLTAPSPKMGGRNLGQPQFTDESKLRESSKQGRFEFSEA